MIYWTDNEFKHIYCFCELIHSPDGHDELVKIPHYFKMTGK